MGLYIVTGANRGIGLEYVRQLTSAAQPNTVIASVRSLAGEHDELKALSSNMTRNSTLQILECETSSVESIRAFAEKAGPIIDNQGGGRVDVLINNAGINAVPEQNSLTMDAKDLHQHIAVNVIGPAEVVKAFSPYLGKGSVVVNMTSGLGSCGKNVVKCTTYAISKAALNMLSVHQAGDFEKIGVRVVCLDPGWVKTRMGGEEAMIEAEESVKGLLDVVEKMQKGEDGGEVGRARFMLYDGSEVPW